MTPRRVKVRLSFEGRRYIGYLELPEGVYRVSDVLNDPSPFLKLIEVSSLEPLNPNSYLAVRKSGISYVQALEEVENPKRLVEEGTFVPVIVKLRMIQTRIAGHAFVPQNEKDIIHFLNLSRPFLNLKDVEILGTAERYEYLAVGKNQIAFVEVMPPGT